MSTSILSIRDVPSTFPTGTDALVKFVSELTPEQQEILKQTGLADDNEVIEKLIKVNNPFLRICYSVM